MRVVGGSAIAVEICQNIVEHAGTTGWVVHVYNFRRRLGRKAAVIARV